MTQYRYSLKKFVKDWMLIIGMTAGAGLYLIYHSMPALHPAGPVLESLCRTVQPVLLFLMLFLSFSRIEPGQMRPHKWMLWLLLVQALCFSGISFLVIWAESSSTTVALWLSSHCMLLESAMVCLVCPTATACAVVTGKLGGNMAGVVTYTVLVNILVAILVPLLVPLVHPVEGMSFGITFSKILAKVFPLLIMPCVSAWLVRYLLPGLHSRLLEYPNLSFYIWSVSLTLAILMSTRALVQSHAAVGLLLGMALSSLLCCVFQFWAGKKIGGLYGFRITAGQALGQKNTVFAIWMAYTFMNPVISIVGGFYSFWHNCYNTWQLYRKRIGSSKTS